MKEGCKINKCMEVGREMRTSKEGCFEEQCDATGKWMKAGSSKQAYDTLKALTKISQQKATVIGDKESKLLTCSDEDELHTPSRHLHSVNQPEHRKERKPSTSTEGGDRSSNEELDRRQVAQSGQHPLQTAEK